MTPQDREALQSLLTQLTQIQGVNKDPEADLLIREAVARQPDATYLLVQRALLLGAALDQARTRIAEQARAAQRAREEVLDPPQAPWARGAPSTGGATAPPPAAGAAAAAPSLLGQAAATAAGVAGGAFLFQGIEDLLGHHGSPFSTHDAATALPTEDVTVNNYYGDRGDEEQRTSFDRDDDDVTDFGDDTI